MDCQWKDKVLAVTEPGFEDLALQLFHFQYRNNPLYRQYTDAIRVGPDEVKSLSDIPFLPISFFKTHRVQSTSFEAALVFESSGTTGTANSRHYIKNIDLYKQSFIKGFELFYGSVKDWCIIGLLPSYLERQNSSLVFMVNELIRLSENKTSGFYLNEFDKLFEVVNELETQQQKTLLIGVTFALLDFADFYAAKSGGKKLHYITVMETGGMKGRRKEMIREEVHAILKKSFGLALIHSEYGMTELLSQAYSSGNGIFKSPPWMKILLRDEEDPFEIKMPRFQTEASERGVINVIDLANIYSCCFIATDDAGKLYSDGSFEVLGRIDNSDLRGCSLMVV
jgi:phenylacetate-coenzyme A ligase PaaK-like adenylate-forming protein